LVVLPDAGHLLASDAEEEVASAVLGHLDRASGATGDRGQTDSALADPAR
jgi:hypothetical protein